MREKDYPTLDEDVSEDIKKLDIERKNAKQFFEDPTYLDSDEPVGDDEFWMLKIVEEDGPVGRPQGWTLHFAIEDKTNVPTEKMDDDLLDTIFLDRVQFDTEGDARFVVRETNQFDDLTELWQFCHKDEE